MKSTAFWYFADPMCSWCWGFSPVLKALQEEFGDVCNFVLILGGLRPGTREPVTDSFRNEIFHHWAEVHRRSGQAFSFDGALPPGFVYDTEPPSRAVITMAQCEPGSTLAFFTRLQVAFYVEQQDITTPDTLKRLAGEWSVAPETFYSQFTSQAVREKTRAHFRVARELDVRGFPTLMLQHQERYHLLASGYQPYSQLKPEVARLLAPSS
jgi:putative protein-disulfide isomerase